MFTQMKMYVAGGILFIILGLGATIWIQSGRIDRLKAELNQERVNKEACLYANAEGLKTIDSLQKELGKSGKTCDQRIRAKDDVIKKLQNIDNLSGGNHEPNGDNVVAGPGAGDTGGTDALLSALNGMLPGQGSGENGVCQTDDTHGASGTPMVSGEIRSYRFCSDEDVKNMLKDWVLCRADANDLRTILTRLQTNSME